jgi:hypothetical protein
MHHVLCYSLRPQTFDPDSISKETHAPTRCNPFDTSATNEHCARNEALHLGGQIRLYNIHKRQYFLSGFAAPMTPGTYLSGAMSLPKMQER